MKITKNTPLIKLSGLVIWRPSECSDFETRFAIPNDDETFLDIDQLKNLHEFLTIIINENIQEIDIDKTVKFKTLKIGQEFECYGDVTINYNYPKICKCIKDSEDLAHEIDGISFYISSEDSVFL